VRVRSIDHEVAGIDIIPRWVHCRQPVLCRQVHEASALGVEHGASKHSQSTRARPRHVREGPVEIGGTPRLNHLQPHPQRLCIERRITGQRIWKVVKAVGIRAGMSALHPHALRHACGAELLRRTKNLRVVQEQLRHVDVQTTTGYTRLTQQDVRQALETLDDEGE
jgi:integrase